MALPNWTEQRLTELRSADCITFGKKFEKTPKSAQKVEAYLALKAFSLCSKTWNEETLEKIIAKVDSKTWTDFEKTVFTQDFVQIDLWKAEKTEDLQDDVLALIASFPFEKNIHQKEALIKKALELAQKTENQELVGQVQRALTLHSPRLDKEIIESNPFLAARNHRAWREFDQALKIYDKVFQSSDGFQTKLESLQNKRNTLRSQQLRKDVLEFDKTIQSFLEKELEKSTDPKIKSEVAQKLADHIVISSRAIWTDGQVSAAQTLITNFLTKLESLANVDEFYFLLGRMSEEKKDYEKALEYFSKIHRPDGDPSLFKRTLWTQGWMTFKLGRYEDAQKYFSDLANISEETNEKLRSQFWQAESLKKLKHRTESRKIFTDISKEDPFGYYGIMANRELKRRFTPLRAAKKNFRFSNPFKKLNPEKTTLLQTLIDFDWKENIEIALESLKPDLDKNSIDLGKNLKKHEKQIKSLQQEFMLTYAKAGIYLPLFASTSQMKPEARNELLTRHPEVLFPLDFLDIIQKAAKKFQIDPELILSIIRQESAFNPLAKSHAEAYGLMQMLPSVAAEYASKAEVDFKEAIDLYVPEKNIPIGASFLSDLYFKRWKKKLIPAVASYNASQKAVQNWIDTRYQNDILIFIEEVPYEETRGYIKLVLRNYILYKKLLAKKSFSFPEAFLEMK